MLEVVVSAGIAVSLGVGMDLVKKKLKEKLTER